MYIAMNSGDVQIVSRLLDAGGNVDITFGAMKKVLYLLIFPFFPLLIKPTDSTSCCQCERKFANGKDIN